MNRKTVVAVAGIGLAALIAVVVVTGHRAAGAPPFNGNDLRSNPSAFTGQFNHQVLRNHKL